LAAVLRARHCVWFLEHGCLQHRRDLEEVYDAVITDPPYGVRAGGRKSVAKPDIHIGDVDSHYPQTDPYPLGECLRDLLDAAAKSLRTGGRLVRCSMLWTVREP